MSSSCPLCASPGAQVFFDLPAMPVSIGVQWPSAAEARACGKGDLILAFCPSCGFIWNQAFDAGRLEYSQRYDNSLDFSPVFQDYARALARRLIDAYDIRGKDVVEIGCGKGHFLSLLCEEGKNRGFGFDPSYEGARFASAASARITYVQDFYGEKYTGQAGDLICSRHVFEHIPDPLGFLGNVRRTIGERHSAVIYFEVPNVRFILEGLSIWDILYEHCNYFGRESLAGIFRRCGFQLLRLEESYGGQFLCIDCRLAGKGAAESAADDDVADLAGAVARFSERAQAHLQSWRARLAELEKSGRRVAVWGGGTKGVSFLNMLKVFDAIPYVVDINPYKQGRFLPGTGQKIIAPPFLKEYRPDVVILMNPIYRDEVQVELQGMGIAAELWSV